MILIAITIFFMHLSIFVISFVIFSFNSRNSLLKIEKRVNTLKVKPFFLPTRLE